MGLKSPSKYLSLEYLRMLQNNDYCNKDTGADYVDEEVDDLVWDKVFKRSDQIGQKRLKEERDFYLTLQKENRVKFCSNCRTERSFTLFHVDKSKKYFNLRSWCKLCRKKKSR